MSTAFSLADLAPENHARLQDVLATAIVPVPSIDRTLYFVEMSGVERDHYDSLIFQRTSKQSLGPGKATVNADKITALMIVLCLCGSKPDPNDPTKTIADKVRLFDTNRPLMVLMNDAAQVQKLLPGVVQNDLIPILNRINKIGRREEDKIEKN